MSKMAESRGSMRGIPPENLPDPVKLSDEFPGSKLVKAFGVDYAHVKAGNGGDLYLTQWGWPFREFLQPENWEGGTKSGRWERLQGSSAVYKVATKPVRDRIIDLVVKWNRVGVEAQVDVDPRLRDKVSVEDQMGARFNSPFEEFGIVMELRRGDYGDPSVRILTQKPLAIYSPPGVSEQWKTGRKDYIFMPHKRSLQMDQADRARSESVELDIEKTYAVIYGWVKGDNAYNVLRAAGLGDGEIERLTMEGIERMDAKGFRTIDPKPAHMILRIREDGSILKRHGKYVWADIDLELAQRTREHQIQYQHRRRAEYFRHLSHVVAGHAPHTFPPNLKPMNALGTDYVWGGTETTGGQLFVLGSDPELFDYFRPERWMWTPDAKISQTHEIYHSRTKDNINIVWQSSRVGASPEAEFGAEAGARAQKHGFNSPFEEFEIAERLRRHGVSTTYPRAIYMSGREYDPPSRLEDDSRFESHSRILTPGGEPILRPDRRYITIWGYWGGIDPLAGYREEGHWGSISLEHALEKGVVTAKAYDDLAEYSKGEAARLHLDPKRASTHLVLMSFTDQGDLKLAQDGKPQLTVGVDAFQARQIGLLAGSGYDGLMADEDAKILKAGYENLNPNGNHLLLTYDLGLGFRTNGDGSLQATHCVFDLFKKAGGLW
jgi:hypothetical protein